MPEMGNRRLSFMSVLTDDPPIQKLPGTSIRYDNKISSLHCAREAVHLTRRMPTLAAQSSPSLIKDLVSVLTLDVSHVIKADRNEVQFFKIARELSALPCTHNPNVWPVVNFRVRHESLSLSDMA
jgi:hypothetical protein